MKKDFAADGLRGVAALNVILCHFFISFFPLGFIMLYPGSATPDALPSRVDKILSTPFLSILWNGNFAVCVFFVLSGYVLTKSFCDGGSLNILQKRCARRFFRFLIPILMSVMLSYIIIITGLGYWREASAISHSAWLAHFWTFEPSFVSAIQEGLYSVLLNGVSHYTPPLWTMKVEFIGSLLVFAYRALQIKDSKATIINLIVFIFVMYKFFPVDWIYYIAFIAGSHLNDIKFRLKTTSIVLLSFITVYFGAYDNSIFYSWIQNINIINANMKNIFNVIGGIALVTIVRNGNMDFLLLTRPIQFIGSISYSIYLVHFPILLSFSTFLYIVAYRYGFSNAIAIPINLVSTLTVIIIIAILFNKYFDKGSIRLSKTIFK